MLLVHDSNIVVVTALALVWLFVAVWPERAGTGPLVGAAVGAVLALAVLAALSFPGRTVLAWETPPTPTSGDMSSLAGRC